MIDIVHDVGSFMIIPALLSYLAFTLLYFFVGSWRDNKVGRAVIFHVGSWSILLITAGATLVFGEGNWIREILRLVAYTSVAATSAHLLSVLIRLQRDEEKGDTSLSL